MNSCVLLKALWEVPACDLDSTGRVDASRQDPCVLHRTILGLVSLCPAGAGWRQPSVFSASLPCASIQSYLTGNLGESGSHTHPRKELQVPARNHPSLVPFCCLVSSNRLCLELVGRREGLLPALLCDFKDSVLPFSISQVHPSFSEALSHRAVTESLTLWA